MRSPCLEQPCDSYEECLAIRRRTDHPFVLDEVIDGMTPVLGAGPPADAQEVDQLDENPGVPVARVAHALNQLA